MDEFLRNREAQIADALKKFEEQKLPKQFPQICKDYAEFGQIRDAIKKYEENKNKILQKLREDAKIKNLGADKLISDLFIKSKLIEYNEEILSAAKLRIELGNQPGKKGSYGDAVNWETILAVGPSEDFYLITHDKDYISEIDERKLAQFLQEEWSQKKGTHIYFFSKLSVFFKDKFPRINLASELEKELALNKLVNSRDFKTTHEAIAQLSEISDFTLDEINEMVRASVKNSQIFWIKNDSDVKSFFNNIVVNHEKEIDPTLITDYYIFYGQSEKEAPK